MIDLLGNFAPSVHHLISPFGLNSTLQFFYYTVKTQERMNDPFSRNEYRLIP